MTHALGTPVPVRARGEGAHQVLLARLAADGHDLVLLHVGAEAELMAPPHHGQVVGKREGLMRRPPLRR
jgi:hypothetical protein